MTVIRSSPMSVQDSLPGMHTSPKTESLFFCLFPDALACEAIAEETNALRVEHSLIGPSIRPNRLHATLHYLGEHAIDRQDIVDAATAAAARVVHSPFDVTLTRASSFSNRADKHPCVLLFQEERPPIHGLWRELGNHLMAAGLARYLKREFMPHVTLLYDTRVLAVQDIEPIHWQARDFSLVRSRAMEYEVLASWPLRA
ncbi:MAG: 2'-5' RNA ligase family protein [Pseudoxanthomonas sp.]